jgi:hypothetical protein
MDDDHQGLPPPAAILGDNEAQWNPPGFFVPPPLLQPHQQQQHQHHPENDVESHGSPRSSGWSEVETVGGVPPSARSLHSAALLNVSSFLAAFLCGKCLTWPRLLEQSPGKLTCADGRFRNFLTRTPCWCLADLLERSEVIPFTRIPF